mmetsp:Transcript_12540/g.24464  ORF Transcript_12540/g.24464 Transcript_12540/m.24464 type:complete len:283 (-) Transcript_12540:1690-2538(-)
MVQTPDAAFILFIGICCNCIFLTSHWVWGCLSFPVLSDALGHNLELFIRFQWILCLQIPSEESADTRAAAQHDPHRYNDRGWLQHHLAIICWNVPARVHNGEGQCRSGNGHYLWEEGFEHCVCCLIPSAGEEFIVVYNISQDGICEELCCNRQAIHSTDRKARDDGTPCEWQKHEVRHRHGQGPSKPHLYFTEAPHAIKPERRARNGGDEGRGHTAPKNNHGVAAPIVCFTCAHTTSALQAVHTKGRISCSLVLRSNDVHHIVRTQCQENSSGHRITGPSRQ